MLLGRCWLSGGLVWLVLALAVWGQEDAAERRVVTLTDPSRPGTVKVQVLNGSITVQGYEGSELVIAANRRGLKVDESDNRVNVQVDPGAQVDLRLSVPSKTSLELKCTNGGQIRVEAVAGEIEAEGVNASIDLRKIRGAVVAHSLQGRVLVQMDQVTPGKPLSFSSMNGDVDVTLPADTKGDVKLQTLNGAIHIDFPLPPGGEARQKPGKQRTGAINGGGPAIQLHTLNGGIHLRKSEPSHP